MNPLKNLFTKVFETTPAEDAKPPKEDTAFEWNPEEESVAPTSARMTSWRRDEVSDGEPTPPTLSEASHATLAASAQSLPTPEFEWEKTPKRPVAEPLSEAAPALDAWVRPAAPETPAPSPKPVAEPVAVIAPPAPPVLKAPPAPSAPPQIPLSDFEDVYRKAGIKSPVHGYGVERVYRLLTSRRLVGLDRNVRRSALLTALDAAGVPPSDVSQDAVLRRKALEAFEAEKALELQSLRSRNESRAEALQETVETFTRQKQGQIERLAQGSTAAVRAQSDLEIRKRMEQDRLFRSLAYFVESLPPAGQLNPAFIEPARVIERTDATVEITPPREGAPASFLPGSPALSEIPVATAQLVRPPADEEAGADTRPLSQSGLEMALRAAAEEARAAGWGKAGLIEDTVSDPEAVANRLREAKKADSQS